MKTIFKAILTVASLLMVAMSACTDDHVQPDPDASKTYVLVHGAFQGAYAWKYITPQLEQKGHKVLVVELPAHGDDMTPPSEASLKLYAEKVIKTINTVSGKVILVGHSMGGVVVTSVTEQIPDRIQKLIYIAAFVPRSGQSLFELISTDSTSLLPAALIPSADGLTHSLEPSRIVPIFAQDANAEVAKLLVDKRKPEPSKIFPETFPVTDANWGRVNKHYIFTTRDNTVGPNLQKRMVAAAKIKNTTILDADHCPFLTQPKVIGDFLLEQQ